MAYHVYTCSGVGAVGVIIETREGCAREDGGVLKTIQPGVIIKDLFWYVWNLPAVTAWLKSRR